MRQTENTAKKVKFKTNHLLRIAERVVQLGTWKAVSNHDSVVIRGVTLKRNEDKVFECRKVDDPSILNTGVVAISPPSAFVSADSCVSPLYTHLLQHRPHITMHSRTLLR